MKPTEKPVTKRPGFPVRLEPGVDAKALALRLLGELGARVPVPVARR